LADRPDREQRGVSCGGSIEEETGDGAYSRFGSSMFAAARPTQCIAGNSLARTDRADARDRCGRRRDDIDELDTRREFDSRREFDTRPGFDI